jgi:hypothetical protein
VVALVTVDSTDSFLLVCGRSTIADFGNRILEPTLRETWAWHAVLSVDYPAGPGCQGSPLVTRSDRAVGTGNVASDDIHLREVVICCRVSVVRIFESVLEYSRPPAGGRRQVTS